MKLKEYIFLKSKSITYSVILTIFIIDYISVLFEKNLENDFYLTIIERFVADLITYFLVIFVFILTAAVKYLFRNKN